MRRLIWVFVGRTSERMFSQVAERLCQIISKSERRLLLQSYTGNLYRVRVYRGPASHAKYDPVLGSLYQISKILHTSLSYTMVRAHVRCDNARAWASALSHVHAQNHGITDLSHLHACRSSTSRDISCWMLGIQATMWWNNVMRRIRTTAIELYRQTVQSSSVTLICIRFSRHIWPCSGLCIC